MHAKEMALGEYRQNAKREELFQAFPFLPVKAHHCRAVNVLPHIIRITNESAASAGEKALKCKV